MFFKWAITLILAGILSGCGIRTYHPSNVPEKLEEVRLPVTPGQTTRNEVNEQLGKAAISNDEIEVYRVLQGEEVIVDYFAFIPIFWNTEDVIIYAMVVYDENDIVEAIDWDIYQIQGTNPWREAKLEAVGYTFDVHRSLLTERRNEIILAPASATQNILFAQPPEGRCSVIYFLEEGIGAQRDFYVNDRRVGEMPITSRINQPRIFSKVFVPGGEHEIKVKMANLKPRLFTQKVFCEPGNIIYVYPQIRVIETEPYGIWRTRYKHQGVIAITNKPLESHDTWRSLLFYDGKWLDED